VPQEAFAFMREEEEADAALIDENEVISL